MKLIIKTVDSLQKVFLGKEPQGEIAKATVFSNERYHYQIAVCYQTSGEKAFDALRMRVYPEVESPIRDAVVLRKVVNVPSEFPVYNDHDDFVECTEPGLYPDPLAEIDKTGVSGPADLWYSIWVTVDARGLQPGTYPVRVVVSDGTKQGTGTSDFSLTILPAKLAKQKLIYTNWFHADCLYTHYQVPAFSQKHWNLIKEYFAAAAKRGMNMVLTPVFTPPLDTAVGGERPTVQLVDVYKDADRYTFEFSRLKRWIRLAQKCGIDYFEISHLFTQWGAAHAPKIMAYEKGELKQIFGWQTDAEGKEYSHFLSVFLPALSLFLKENKIAERTYFHISDEPSPECIGTYKKVSETVKKYLNNEFKIIEALSDYEFYKTGLVDTPIPSLDHFDTFYDNGVEGLWTYYCCGQYKKVANRFFCMPSVRNRILGFLLYKYNVKGFLQWGFNFWYSQFSLSPVDPYLTTDAGGAFPSGDAFSVYPGKDGKPVCSLRLEVFGDALQDFRALTALEKKIGREKVISLLDAGLDEPLSMTCYPKDSGWLIAKREQINSYFMK